MTETKKIRKQAENEAERREMKEKYYVEFHPKPNSNHGWQRVIVGSYGEAREHIENVFSKYGSSYLSAEVTKTVTYFTPTKED